MPLKEENKYRIDLDEVIWGNWDDDGNRLVLFNEKLYNGYVVYDRFSNGDVEAEIEYKDGSHMGWENEYNVSGYLTYSCLTLGETSLEIYKYDDNGILIEHWRSVGDDYYDEMVTKYNLLD